VTCQVPGARRQREALVGREGPDVVEALASGREEQHQRLDLLDIRVSAASLSYLDVLLDGPVGAERSHRLEYQRQPCPRRRLPELLGHLDHVGQDPLRFRLLPGHRFLRRPSLPWIQGRPSFPALLPISLPSAPAPPSAAE
jgi:hypothetical protein